MVCNTLDICVTFGSLASVVFNAKKSLCVAVSKKIMYDISPMMLGNLSLKWVHCFKYLGIKFQY